MKQKIFTDYSDYQELRGDLEGDGYNVWSHSDFGKGQFTLKIERTSSVPEGMLDPDGFELIK